MYCTNLICVLVIVYAFFNTIILFHKWPGFPLGLDTYHLSYACNSQLLSGTFLLRQNALFGRPVNFAIINCSFLFIVDHTIRLDFFEFVLV